MSKKVKPSPTSPASTTPTPSPTPTPAIKGAWPITLSLATNRTDKGQTDNYRVYEGGGTAQVKNKRGEVVTKSVLLGGNGTIYLINELAGAHDEFVLLPRAAFERMVKGAK